MEEAQQLLIEPSLIQAMTDLTTTLIKTIQVDKSTKERLVLSRLYYILGNFTAQPSLAHASLVGILDPLLTSFNLFVQHSDCLDDTEMLDLCIKTIRLAANTCLDSTLGQRLAQQLDISQLIGLIGLLG